MELGRRLEILYKKMSNKFSGKFNGTETQSMICTDKWLHDGKSITHFENGEKKCRACNIFYKLLWTHNNCMMCGRRLATSSRYRKRD